jgi:NAD(P)-dependent dehydrogenase (short-subunit alcohol dehydrogenase family)
MKNVMITGQENEFDQSLAEIFAREGYEVYINGFGDVPEMVGIYIDVSDGRDAADTFTVRGGMDEGVIRAVFEQNVLKPMALLEKYINVLDAGNVKRLCFLTSAEAGINGTREINGYAYKMSKAAMHNFFQMVSNRLTPNGYTMRVFDPMRGEIAPRLAAEAAFNYFTRRRGTERANPLRDDEARLVLRDALGREHSW